MHDLKAALKSVGIIPIEHEGWQTRYRPGVFEPFGVIVHHTAAGGTKEFPSLSTVVNGRPNDGIPGPLCNFLVGRKTGRVYLISNGRANDSGRGSGQVFKDLNRNIAPTGTAANRNLTDTMDGNPYFYDIEVESNGVDEIWSPEVVATVVKINVALCRLHDWSPNRIIGHTEWTRRKVDPRPFDMAWLRSEVRGTLLNQDPTSGGLLMFEVWRNKGETAEFLVCLDAKNRAILRWAIDQPASERYRAMGLTFAEKSPHGVTQAPGKPLL